jgi:hypothetical protein
MTLSEFSEEFDLLYNNLTSNSAPPLDEYEKSVLLTQAQERLVRSYYDAFKNATNEGFEANEERTRELATIVKNVISTSPVTDAARALKTNSRFFALATDVMYLIFEEATLSSLDLCLNGKICSIKAVKHDEYRYLINNPFKKPSESTVFKLNVSPTSVIELIADENATVAKYQYRYLKYPSPIVLGTLTGGLTINGITAATLPELPQSTHRKILDLAVQIALEAVGNPRLQSKLAIDNKKEY